jgi:hypothetical protein
MGAVTATPNYHGQLAANTVDVVTMNADWESIQVVNRSGTAEIYFTVNGTAATVGGANCYVLPACLGVATPTGINFNAVTVIQLISSGTPTYSIIGGL